MESVFRFQSPQNIFYGNGSLEQLGAVAARSGKRALMISDEMMNGLGYVEKTAAYLKSEHIESSVYLGVRSEPTDEYVEEALAQLKEEQCDFIVSVGGGSCIDTAKAVAVLATNPGYIGEFMGGKRLAANAPLPHVAIPTTAGTGSEVTDVTVITATKTDVKMMIKQLAFMPTAAIVDPLLTLSSPKSVTASTGMDALSHAIEAFISKKAHHMTDMYALAAMEQIIPNLKRVYQDGNDIEARRSMSLGSMQAGAAFSNASVCLVHGMSRPVGALFHVPHGMSNAMLLPPVLEFSKEYCIERLAVIGKLFARDGDEPESDREYAELAVKQVRELAAFLNIPNLQGWGVDGERFHESLGKMARDAIDSGSPANNPRVPTVDEIIELYKTSYSYKF